MPSCIHGASMIILPCLWNVYQNSRSGLLKSPKLSSFMFPDIVSFPSLHHYLQCMWDLWVCFTECNLISCTRFLRKQSVTLPLVMTKVKLGLGEKTVPCLEWIVQIVAKPQWQIFKLETM
jgi:hypothetical protein